MKFETVCASLVLCYLCVQTAFAADAPAVLSQDATIQEVVNVANKVIKTACEPSLAAPNTVATMIPYTPEALRGMVSRNMPYSGRVTSTALTVLAPTP